MLTLLYALALSSAVGDCDVMLAATDIDAYNNCTLSETSNSVEPLRPMDQPVLGRRINTYADLANQRAIHAAEERDAQLRMALEQQRIERFNAEMQRINQQFRANTFNPYFTVVGANGTVSTWRVIDLW